MSESRGVLIGTQGSRDALDPAGQSEDCSRTEGDLRLKEACTHWSTDLEEQKLKEEEKES